ncbi:MAG: hemerythrin domain-containing protein [Acidobacteria bacterium]|nr:hemerythrin domain-containing protein [Acidobacteriota bacterium]
MSQMADRFTSMFRDEHRAVRDSLLDLVDAFTARDIPRAGTLLGRIAGLTGPHFRYEEEVMYPALVGLFGPAYIAKLYQDHNQAIGAAQGLVALAGKSSWSDDDVRKGVELTRAILPHVSDCDGLSIMVERLGDGQIGQIFTARDRSNAAGLDLLRWAAEVRRPPTLPAA